MSYLSNLKCLELSQNANLEIEIELVYI